MMEEIRKLVNQALDLAGDAAEGATEAAAAATTPKTVALKGLQNALLAGIAFADILEHLDGDA